MGSLGGIRPYFRTHFKALGFTEHEDGFNINNIPETVLDKSFHIGAPVVVGGPVSHTHQDTNSEVNVAVFFRGYRSTTEAIDEAMVAMDTIIKRCCTIKNRTQGGGGVFNVVFEDGTPQELSSEENENTVFVNMRFTVRVLMGIEET